jgi:hypothetical protein
MGCAHPANLTCPQCAGEGPTLATAGRQAAPAAERRQEPRPLRGGSRAGDPPLTTRDCADWMGMSATWVRSAIDDGVWTARGRVRLGAETIVVNRRKLHRVHLDSFIEFLRAIGWRRVPRHPRDAQSAA